tara:strand:- start:19666 stop:20661 length:996 start_codon:yes stop_codon:yes gene_type:complete
MIITRAPYRISFLGGGTDVKDWYMGNGGGVISAAIDKYVYVQLKEQYSFFPTDLHHRVIWRKIEKEKKINNIKNPIVRAAYKFNKINSFYDCFYSGELPSMSGSGSSSAFTVALLKGLNEVKNINKNKFQIFKDAVNVEREMIKEHGGIQDQFRSALGGLSYMNINSKGIVKNVDLKINKMNVKKLENSLEVYFIQGSRSSSSLMHEHKLNININKILLKEMNELTKIGVKILNSNKKNFIREFSDLINVSWNIKKRFHKKVSSEKIDNIIKKSLSLGAFTGKVMGAGSSGFIFFLKNPDNKLNLNKHFKEVVGPLGIKFDSFGVKTIFKS